MLSDTFINFYIEYLNVTNIHVCVQTILEFKIDL